MRGLGGGGAGCRNLDHGVEQVLSSIEWQVERQCTQVFEEGAPRRQAIAHAPVARIVQIRQRVGEKPQEDETPEQVGQMGAPWDDITSSGYALTNCCRTT